MLKYGIPSAKRKTHTVTQDKSRARRIEQLKQIYKRGMEIDTGMSKARDMGEEREEGRVDGESGDEVDQLLQWTQNLDDQVLSTSSIAN